MIEYDALMCKTYRYLILHHRQKLFCWSPNFVFPKKYLGVCYQFIIIVTFIHQIQSHPSTAINILTGDTADTNIIKGPALRYLLPSKQV